jgi:hypothetical protein
MSFVHREEKGEGDNKRAPSPHPHSFKKPRSIPEVRDLNKKLIHYFSRLLSTSIDQKLPFVVFFIQSPVVSFVIRRVLYYINPTFGTPFFQYLLKKTSLNVENIFSNKNFFLLTLSAQIIVAL